MVRHRHNTKQRSPTNRPRPSHTHTHRYLPLEARKKETHAQTNTSGVVQLIPTQTWGATTTTKEQCLQLKGQSQKILSLAHGTGVHRTATRQVEVPHTARAVAFFCKWATSPPLDIGRGCFRHPAGREFDSARAGRVE